MKSPRFAEDVVPIAEFKGRAAAWFRRAARTGRAVLVTHNGKPAGVLLAPADFDRLTERQRFLESIAAGIADAEAGRILDTTEVRRRLGLGRSRRKK